VVTRHLLDAARLRAGQGHGRAITVALGAGHSPRHQARVHWPATWCGLMGCTCEHELDAGPSGGSARSGLAAPSDHAAGGAWGGGGKAGMWCMGVRQVGAVSPRPVGSIARANNRVSPII
jgi:hypothetical protein